MVSSDDEVETFSSNVSEYEFVFGEDEPISFAELPIEWCKGGTPDGNLKQIFLRGKTDNGLRKIYKQVTAWKFDLSCKKPEISVLSIEGYWIQLLKPRKAFEVMIRTILIAVHFLHFVKWNPQRSYKALWDHLTKTFSMFENRPSDDDLKDHMSLIHEAVKRDETLAKSKLWHAFLERKPGKKKISNEDLNPPFIVDDVTEDDDQDSDKASDDEVVEADDENDCFDYVCAICDNGGHIYLCEGKCMRSFHGTIKAGEESNCASLGFTKEDVEAIKNVDFYCKNCLYKQHQCFSCGELGSSDESSGAEVFRCVNGACGHFYHPGCVAKLLHPGDEAAAEEHRQRIAAGEHFACPVHKCYVCNEVEEESEELHFAICRRCPRAYHIKCMPRGIASEEDVKEGRATIQRAWTGLIPNRVLIYCLKHKIDVSIATPPRNHIKFPGPQGVTLRRLPIEINNKDPLKGRSIDLEDAMDWRSSAKPSKLVEKVSPGSKQGDLVRKRVDKLPVKGSSKKQKVAANRYSAGNFKKHSNLEDRKSLGAMLHATFYGSDSETDKPSQGEMVPGGRMINEKLMPTTKKIDDSVTLDADAKKRILTLIKDVSSSITLEDIKRKHRAPSTFVQYSKFAVENVTLGKVEGSVQAVRAALRKLEKGGSVQDAKTVCGNDLLVQVMKWKEKMKVYLAPFLYGMRYTSFGRHFTKMDKLKEIVDMLHWYTQDGDMIVDFCCGSNDFSCFMKKKLDEMEKKCSFKNYDILQAKNDFSFERRDWMGVKRNELPEGSRLIMGLNPPFGVNAALANKFIDKALEFKPKLLILIVPRETQRLDKKESPYDLIWEDDQMLAGKSFYLPGSVDVNDKQIEDWNMNAPVLYLWSRPDWTSKHKVIAEQHGHLSGSRKNYGLEESRHSMHNPNISQECHILDEAGHPDEQENQEEESRVITSHKEALPRDISWTGGDNNHGRQNNHSEKSAKDFGGKRKRKRVSKNNAGNKSPNKHSVSLNRSPNVADGCLLDAYPSEYLERQPQIHVGRDDYQQFDHGNFPAYSSYSQTRDDEDFVRKYGVKNDRSMSGRQPYAPIPNPDYGFSALAERHMGYPEERTSSLSNSSYRGNMGQRYGSDSTLPSQMNILAREEPNSWSQRPEYAFSSGSARISSPYGQLNPAANSTYGGVNTSAMQRYAPRLNEMDHTRMNNTISGPPVPDAIGIYNPSVPRPVFQPGSSGFAPGPYRPYSQQNSCGWLNE